MWKSIYYLHTKIDEQSAHTKQANANANRPNINVFYLERRTLLSQLEVKIEEVTGKIKSIKNTK